MGSLVLLLSGRAPASVGLGNTREVRFHREAHAVVTAGNGRIGLALAKEEKPDFILYDVMMPEMDGHAVLHARRKDPSVCRTPFIFLTVRSEKHDLRSATWKFLTHNFNQSLVAPKICRPCWI